MLIREKILIVEDEKSIAHFISTILNNNGYDAMKARSGSIFAPILIHAAINYISIRNLI